MKLYILLILILTGCNSKESESLCLNQFNNDTIKQSIPEKFRNSKSRQVHSDFITAIGLCQLEKGFDSIQIRLEYTNSDYVRYLVISNSNNKWKAMLLTVFWDNSGKIPVNSLNRNYKNLRPYYSWVNFESFINNSEILTMPDASEINNYSVSSGGPSVTVEISSKNLYKFYNYPDLFGNLETSPEAKKMEKIIQGLEKEFSIKF